jgi:UDP-N-acetylmuramoyl-tripeptide--D-alanyl-D-alanine ligase
MKLNVLKNEGTQNNHIGVPLTLLKLKASHQCVVLECGTNQPGDIPWLSEVAQPDVAVFTNIGESHLEKLKTPKGVLKEKWALTSRLGKRGIAVINADDSLLFQANKTRGIRSLTYGTKPSSKFYATKIRVEKGRCLNFQIHEHGRSRSIELNTCGFNNVYNALAAYVCGSLMKVPADQIISALKKFEFPKGRGQIVKLGRGWLINDSYNANPVSMRSAIATLQNLETKGKRIMVAADMLELGPKTKEYHEQVGRNIGQHGIDLLITVGTLARHMATAARRLNKTMKVFSFSDIESAQKQLAQILRNSDSVLVKGSRRMAMERIVEFLLSSPQTASE